LNAVEEYPGLNARAYRKAARSRHAALQTRRSPCRSDEEFIESNTNPDIVFYDARTSTANASTSWWRRCCALD
jgi:hypothetical protein